ncbi:MAG: GNAT family N-acetyltransferase [Bdellovibrionaceae bacterium]|nr:GNAT family N-acetyltransferase [Pseudobdellovibrionaceae bacterium]
MTQLNYNFKPIDLSTKGLTDIIDLFNASFGESSPNIKTLEWQYLKNPLGPAVGFNAYFNNELAAHYVTIPTQAKVKGVLKKGLLSLNTATHPQHQKRGLFTKLAELTYQEGQRLAYEFVVGVANHNSVHGFTKKLGFQYVGRLESRLFLCTPQIQDRDLDFNIEWNKEFLNWRLSCPGSRYLIRENNDRAEVFFEHHKFNIKVLVQNLSSNLSPQNINPLSWKRNPFFYWLGVDSRVDWSNYFSIKIPDRLKKIPLNLIFKDLNGRTEIDFNKSVFYPIDFDAY